MTSKRTATAPTAGSKFVAGQATRMATVSSLFPGDLVLTVETTQAGRVDMPKTKKGGTWRTVHSLEVVAVEWSRNRRKVVHFSDAVSSGDFAASTTVIVADQVAGDGFGTADMLEEVQELLEAPKPAKAPAVVFPEFKDTTAALEAFPVVDDEAPAQEARKLWNVRLSTAERAKVEALAKAAGARNAGEWFRDILAGL